MDDQKSSLAENRGNARNTRGILLQNILKSPIEDWGCDLAENQDGKRSFDPAVRDRVRDDIEPFIDALEEAVANPSDDTLEDLRKAADELMRSLAGVMLELGQSSKAE
ncbi:MAG: hypothetical protein JO010_15145 [Alphaproteobacteria bacterium]|nr:hypothetical protein [Alphaproteobacteria bacterium]